MTGAAVRQNVTKDTFVVYSEQQWILFHLAHQQVQLCCIRGCRIWDERAALWKRIKFLSVRCCSKSPPGRDCMKKLGYACMHVCKEYLCSRRQPYSLDCRGGAVRECIIVLWRTWQIVVARRTESVMIATGRELLAEVSSKETARNRAYSKRLWPQPCR